MLHRTLASLLAAALLATACGTDQPPTDPAGQAAEPDRGFPVTVTADNGEATIDQRPEAIVSLSPTATEMLFALGAGDQVVAVDDQSDFPPEAPTSDLSGFEPSVEAIATYEPDLVVLASDPGDVIAGLEALDIPTILHDAPTDLDGAYAQIEQLGAATGNLDGAAGLVAELRRDVDAIVDGLPDHADGLTYYHELDPTYFTATSATFIGDVYAQLGLVNIADAAQGADAGYPQLSAEYLVEADPDLVFLADVQCCDVTAESVAARPGWDQITAVRTGAIVELDGDVASRWGPRVVEYLRTVGDAIAALEPAT